MSSQTGGQGHSTPVTPLSLMHTTAVLELIANARFHDLTQSSQKTVRPTDLQIILKSRESASKNKGYRTNDHLQMRRGTIAGE